MFISLKKSFSKLFFTAVHWQVLKFFNHGNWLNNKIRWMLVRGNPSKCPSTTLNCGSGWWSSFCCINSGQAWVEVCWILHLVRSDADSRYVCFLLSGDVLAQAGNLCVDQQVHEGTLKYIRKTHCTLWNHEGALKYIGKKHYILWNIHEYRE